MFVKMELPSPLGALTLIADDRALVGCTFPAAVPTRGSTIRRWRHDPTLGSHRARARRVLRGRAAKLLDSPLAFRRAPGFSERCGRRSARSRSERRAPTASSRARSAARGACGRRGERQEPDLDHRPVPSRHRRGRQPHRLRRRHAGEALPAGSRVRGGSGSGRCRRDQRRSSGSSRSGIGRRARSDRRRSRSS